MSSAVMRCLKEWSSEDVLSSGVVPLDDSSDAKSWTPSNQAIPNRAIPRQAQPAKRVRPQMMVGSAVLLLSWTVLADWLIYRSDGYSGPALFIALIPAFFLSRWNVEGIRTEPRLLLSVQAGCAALLWLSAIRLMFIGSGWVIVASAVLVTTLALAASRVIPSAIESVAMLMRGPLDGLVWFAAHRMPSVIGLVKGGDQSGARRSAWLTWLMPLLAILVFGGIFVLANPSLIDFVSLKFTWVSNWAWSWLSRLSPGELPFCVAAAVVAAGLFYPKLSKTRIGGTDPVIESHEPQRCDLFPAFRNTLWCLIVLFGLYLAFEFVTLWKRDFPVGFYYAGYAHQGAAWLTIALALATGVLSLIFQGEMLNDGRLQQLKTLSWVWSGANFLLAIAVYNRLGIYVGYNGLTPMRIVGFFGITVVVVGFGLVLLKISHQRGFWWLIRTQLTALMFSLIGLALFPIDYVSHRYNASRVLSGYLPPSVMVAVKNKDDSGMLPLLDLVDCEDPIIREGVRAMLADRQIQMGKETQSRRWHWTRYQYVTWKLADQLSELDDVLGQYRTDVRERKRCINAFEDYAMKWY